MFARPVFAALCALLLAAPATTQPLLPRPGTDRNIAGACAGRDGWADPAPPARVFGNTYYVGTCGITTLLVETEVGLVLLDGGVPQAAELVLANVRKLGFNPRLIRWILVSHEHYDHAGALAEIQRQTGARVVAGPNQAAALRSGQPDPADPQAPLLVKEPMLPVKIDRTQAHATRLMVGTTGFTAWATPTHSPGSTSWTWRDCEGAVCRTIAYADSASTISADGYRFSDNPDRIAAVRRGLTVMAGLPCDILITPHPGQSDLLPRLSGAKPLVQFGACRTYAATATERFEARLAREAAEQKPKPPAK
jgi:metallo-beta-lactamase class B